MTFFFFHPYSLFCSNDSKLLHHTTVLLRLLLLSAQYLSGKWLNRLSPTKPSTPRSHPLPPYSIPYVNFYIYVVPSETTLLYNLTTRTRMIGPCARTLELPLLVGSGASVFPLSWAGAERVSSRGVFVPPSNYSNSKGIRVEILLPKSKTYRMHQTYRPWIS